MKEHSRSLTLICPTCAASRFEFDSSLDETIRQYHCTSCGLNFTLADIKAANSAQISAAVDLMKREILDDVKSSLHKAFKNSKGWKVK